MRIDGISARNSRAFQVNLRIPLRFMARARTFSQILPYYPMIKSGSASTPKPPAGDVR